MHYSPSPRTSPIYAILGPETALLNKYSLFVCFVWLKNSWICRKIVENKSDFSRHTLLIIQKSGPGHFLFSKNQFLVISKFLRFWVKNCTVNIEKSSLNLFELSMTNWSAYIRLELVHLDLSGQFNPTLYPQGGMASHEMPNWLKG